MNIRTKTLGWEEVDVWEDTEMESLTFEKTTKNLTRSNENTPKRREKKGTEQNWEHSRGQTGKDRRGNYTVLDTAMKETVCTWKWGYSLWRIPCFSSWVQAPQHTWAAPPCKWENLGSPVPFSVTSHPTLQSQKTCQVLPGGFDNNGKETITLYKHQKSPCSGQWEKGEQFVLRKLHWTGCGNNGQTYRIRKIIFTKQQWNQQAGCIAPLQKA